MLRESVRPYTRLQNNVTADVSDVNLQSETPVVRSRATKDLQKNLRSAHSYLVV